MATSNAEILAQLEKLAKSQKNAERKEQSYVDFSENTGRFFETASLSDFPAILAAFKRLVKIEEAAKRFYWANRLEGEAKGAQLPRDRIIDAECATMSAVSELTAALKEGKRGGGGE